ncbi:O-antigen ligase [Grimontia sp. AD028]|uniref:O-antigen ligase family protein n=1 Tax=Grimontia sp. AD028 TaxID=1581149 RepID=UPI0018CDD3A5|nr:O-antigen ligase family protein [Grimontia sp. AD028]
MEVIKTSTIPLILHFFGTIYNRSPDRANILVEKSLSFISISLLLFNIPFIFGVLPELSSGIALTALGGDSTGYSGPFQNGHAASISMGAIGLIMLYKFTLQTKRITRTLYLSLFIFSLIVIFNTLVRTGLMMIFIGIFVYLYTFFGIKRILRLLPIGLLIAIIVAFLVSGDEQLMMRLFDGSVYEREYDHWFYNIGSGRLWMAWANLVYWYESGIISWLFGTGIGPSKDNMEVVVGIRVFSHNGFVDALTHNGIIGLYLYLMVLTLSYKLIASCKNKDKRLYSLACSMFFSYLLFVFFQGGSRFFLDVLFSLTLLQLKFSNSNEPERSR